MSSELVDLKVWRIWSSYCQWRECTWLSWDDLGLFIQRKGNCKHDKICGGLDQWIPHQVQERSGSIDTSRGNVIWHWPRKEPGGQEERDFPFNSNQRCFPSQKVETRYPTDSCTTLHKSERTKWVRLEQIDLNDEVFEWEQRQGPYPGSWQSKSD